MGNLRHLLKHFARYKWAVAAGVFCLLFVDGMQLVIPRIIKSAVDDLTYAEAAGANLLGYGLRIAGLAVAIAVFRFFWRFFIIGTSFSRHRAAIDHSPIIRENQLDILWVYVQIWLQIIQVR